MEAVAIPLTAGGTPRAEPRIRAMVRAQMRDADGLRDCCVIDVSTRGLLVTAARPPAHGEFVEFQIGRNRIVGHVKWSGGRRFGVALQQRVSPTAVVEGGNAPIALERSVGQARRRQGMWAGLADNPQMLGRLGTLGMLAVFLLIAGYFIWDMTQSGLAPMREAVAAMKYGD